MKNKMKKFLLLLGKKAAITSVVSLTAVTTFIAYAAFTEPTSAPGSSNQDFLENILGANNANNAFDSSTVAANNDGSAIERLEYLAGQINIPLESLVKSGTAYGVNNNGTMTPVSGAGSALTATAGDVVSGKVFFGSGDSDWTPTTGTYDAFSGYSNQKNQIWDDWKGSASSTNGTLAYAYANNLDQNQEEATWETTTDTSLGGANVASGTVKKDTRTGLYWSDAYDAVSNTGSPDTRTNSFTFNGIVDDADDGLDAEGGQAVDFCEALSLDSDGNGTDETDWYLPSQKELMQGYIDGAANNISNSGYFFWSSTESFNGSSYAWAVFLDYGLPNYYGKTQSNYARCVRR
jgi:hypothetical protein